MPPETPIINVRKQGKSYTSKEFIESVVLELNNSWSGFKILGNNPVYSNTIISNERLPSIPENGQLTNIVTLELKKILLTKRWRFIARTGKHWGFSGTCTFWCTTTRFKYTCDKGWKHFSWYNWRNHGGSWHKQTGYHYHSVAYRRKYPCIRIYSTALFFTVAFPIHFLKAQETFCQKTYSVLMKMGWTLNMVRW